jgi:hypothetical protein
VAYSQKTHQKVVDRLSKRLLWEKRFNAILVALTAGNTVGVLVTNTRWAEITALALSALALLVAVYGLSRNRERLIEQHRVAAQSLWLLRERYLHFIGDLRSRAISEAEGRAKRDALTEHASQVYSSAPETDAIAYAAAQRALKRNEELTFASWEIDIMLPPALRSAALTGTVLPSDPFAGASQWRHRIAKWILGR